MVDLILVEHSEVVYTKTKYIVALVEKNVVVDAQPMVATAVVVSPLIGGILPSHNMYPYSYLGENHMLDSPCLHDQQIEKNVQYKFVGLDTIF